MILQSGSPVERNGATAVELAVILPFLVLFLLGAVDFGRHADYHIAVSNAARAGAENGSSQPFSPDTKAEWEAEIRQAVVDEMSGVNDFEESNLQVLITTQTESEGLWRVTVTVTYPFEMVVDWPGIDNPITLGHTVTFRTTRP